MAVSSRIFGIKINGRKTDSLCPLADMLNHKRPRHTQWYFSDEFNSFVIQSLEDIEVGSEIFDSYGKKCNSRFLLNYGFIVENNDSNEFPYVVKMDKDIKNFEFKSQILNIKSELKLFRLQANLEEQGFYDYISYLRFLFYEGRIDILLNVSQYNYK